MLFVPRWRSINISLHFQPRCCGAWANTALFLPPFAITINIPVRFPTERHLYFYWAAFIMALKELNQS